MREVHSANLIPFRINQPCDRDVLLCRVWLSGINYGSYGRSAIVKAANLICIPVVYLAYMDTRPSIARLSTVHVVPI